MKDDAAQGRDPEDGGSQDGSRGGSSTGKRKLDDREPESPSQPEVEQPDLESTPAAKRERTFFGDMDTDSPSSYPKHVIVPSADQQSHEQKQFLPPMSESETQSLEQATFPSEPPSQGAQVLTPDSVGRGRPQPNYEHQAYPPRHHQPFHEVYRTPSYTPDMDYGRYGGGQPGRATSGPPRRWACDYCNVATFLSYEEACAHEEVCSRRHHQDSGGSQFADPYHRQRPPAYGGPGPPAPAQQGSGLGALYHASQEVVTPPTPYHQHAPNRWGAHHAPPLPVLPHEQSYYRQGFYDMREEHYPHDHHYPPQAPMSFLPGQYMPHDPYHQKRLLLALPSDRDSLSDRQCYVRAEMVEIFAASQKDVAARHSKGAQKLVMGQVGIRCVHCSHLRPRDRAERSVCYPKSICRIYQTVADMQRFHFENCREIPDHVRQLYKKLKTTRPRGVGSPQSYWVSSAKNLGLVDTNDGIRFDADLAKERQQQQPQTQDQVPKRALPHQHQARQPSELEIGNI